MKVLAVLCAALLAFAGAATGVQAGNNVQFVNKDGTTRTIVFTPSPGSAGISSVIIGGGQQRNVGFPNGWQGNWYSVSQGQPNRPGMLGEVKFQGNGGNTFFDVSAIVNPNDMGGVHLLYPSSGQPQSGCATFPCGNAYYHPNDVQTKSTPSTSLVCTLGRNGAFEAEEAAATEEDSEEEAQVAAPNGGNTVQFINNDGTGRTIYFSSGLGPLRVNGWGQATANFPTGWQGNFYSVSDGATNRPGMLGEIKFQGNGGNTYFDVSAIVNPNDISGVHLLFSASGQPSSGCSTFPCGNAYYHPNDVQTKVTGSTNLVCTVGHNGPFVEKDILLPRSMLTAE